MFGWWAQPITSYDDKNKDGILTYNSNAALNEVFVGDSSIFRGYTQPRHLITATPGFEFLNRKLRLQALFDYRGGHLAYNNTERIRCVSRQNCNGLMNPKSSSGRAGDGRRHAQSPVEDARWVLSGRRVPEAS